MPLNLARCICILLLIVSCYPLSARAAQEKTSDLIIISGGNSIEHWKEDKFIDIDGKNAYFAVGTILIAPKTAPGSPLDVKIWGRGINDIVFFELSPLVDALDGIKSAAELRQQLLPPKGKASAQPSAEQSDAEKLEAILKQSTPSKIDALRWKQQTALEQMKRFHRTSFQELWTLYEQQREFAQKWWGRDLSPSQLMSLWKQDATSKTTAMSETDAWPSLIEFLREHEGLSPVLQTKIFALNKPRSIGYLVRMAKGSKRKATSEVFVTANNTEATSFSISLEVEHEDSIFDSSTKFVGAVVSPVSSAFLGAIFGLFTACVGYLFWMRQQKYQRRQEIDKLFTEKKAEKSQAIWNYFNGTYKNLRADTEIESQEKVLGVRDGLMREGIYAIMPYEEIKKINAICDGLVQNNIAQDVALDQLLRANFGEFIREYERG